ncbi:COG4223 family protein [Roseovarius sp.]|uniref:COG4223 family protein n=1 Tax=Roseovarius sp. TaxID=1486281 RepID=UPI003D0EF181
MAKKTSSGAKTPLDKDASKEDDSTQEAAQPEDTVQATDTDTVAPAGDDTTVASGATTDATPDTKPAGSHPGIEDPASGQSETSAHDAMTHDAMTKSDSDTEEPAADTSGPDTPAHDATSETAATTDADTDQTSDGETSDAAESGNSPTATEPATSLPVTAPQPAKGAGVGSMILGGVVAGAIGFAAAYFGVVQQVIPRDEVLVGDVGALNQRVEEQSGTIDALTEKVGGITNTDDSALQAQVEALGTLSDRVAETEQQIEDLAARLGDVEQRPVSESADAATIAAYENELNAAREEFAAQRAELEDLIAQAMQTETVADEAAVAAMQRAAISRVQAALDNGAGFAGAVAELQDTDAEVPDTLASVAEEGVATLSSLQESFPDAARAALDASRDVTGEGTGLKGFLKSQLGVRSLEPREGDDPDAVLSRAEAAVRDGRLQDALAEIETLPEEGRAELSDWAGRAAERLEAVGAAQSLSETLN